MNIPSQSRSDLLNYKWISQALTLLVEMGTVQKGLAVRTCDKRYTWEFVGGWDWGGSTSKWWVNKNPNGSCDDRVDSPSLRTLIGSEQPTSSVTVTVTLQNPLSFSKNKFYFKAILVLGSSVYMMGMNAPVTVS